jgi:hypothetical protein
VKVDVRGLRPATTYYYSYPALRAFRQRRDVTYRQADPGCVPEARRRLLRSEPEVGSADLGEATVDAETSEGKGRIGLSGDQQVEVRR